MPWRDKRSSPAAIEQYLLNEAGAAWHLRSQEFRICFGKLQDVLVFACLLEGLGVLKRRGYFRSAPQVWVKRSFQ